MPSEPKVGEAQTALAQSEGSSSAITAQESQCLLQGAAPRTTGYWIRFPVCGAAQHIFMQTHASTCIHGNQREVPVVHTMVKAHQGKYNLKAGIIPRSKCKKKIYLLI